MAVSLLTHERIKTTLPKAKVLRPFVEKLITKARNATNLASFRYLFSILRDEVIVKKLLENIGPRFAKRPGGYTRIYKYGFRYGDMAPIALIELVDRKADAGQLVKGTTKAAVDEGKKIEHKDTHHKQHGHVPGSRKALASKTGGFSKVASKSSPIRRTSSSSSKSGSSS